MLMRFVLVFVASLLFLVLPARAVESSAGEVETVNTSKQTLVLSTECECGSGKIIQMTFTLKDSTKVLLNGRESKLADIKHGDKVEIEYEQIDDVVKVSATRDG